MPANLRILPGLALGAGLLLQSTAASAALLYQDTFEAGDPVDYTAVTGVMTWGLPDVVGPQGAMTSSSARFSTVGNQGQFYYDQAAYLIPTAVRAITVDFDLMLSGLVGSTDLQFTVALDAPQINILQFGANSVVLMSGPFTRSFANDTVLHVSILFDEVARRWTSSIDGVPLGTSPIYATSELDLRDVRFILGFRSGSSGPAPRTAVYLDNVVISEVPVPGGLALLATALAGLTAGRVRRLRDGLRPD